MGHCNGSKFLSFHNLNSRLFFFPSLLSVSVSLCHASTLAGNKRSALFSGSNRKGENGSVLGAGARLLRFVSQSSRSGDFFGILEVLGMPGSPLHVCSAVSATLTEVLILGYSHLLTKLNKCSFFFMLKSWTVMFTV